MLDFIGEKNARPDPKIFATLGTLPGYVDRGQPPTRKQPWRAVNEVGFVKDVELIIPDEVFELVWRRVEDDLRPVTFARVIMKLEDVLGGEFFTQYIKKGNILMLSEGQPGVDNVFMLRNGVLRLDLDKESYERAGLQGRPSQGGGRKHVKSRYMVEVDLRQPSMLHGKKGFERVIWAAKQVLNRSLTWLFYDVARTSDGTQEGDTTSPLSKHHPTIVDFTAGGKLNPHVRVPQALLAKIAEQNSSPDDIDEWSQEVLEWLGLVALESPRVQSDDHVDAHLCRYALPDGTSQHATPVRILRWRGMVDAAWVTQLLITCIFHYKKLLPASSHHPTTYSPWLALTVHAHPTPPTATSPSGSPNTSTTIDGYTILVTSSNDVGSITRTNPDDDDNKGHDLRSDKDTKIKTDMPKESEAGTAASEGPTAAATHDDAQAFAGTGAAGTQDAEREVEGDSISDAPAAPAAATAGNSGSGETMETQTDGPKAKKAEGEEKEARRARKGKGKGKGRRSASASASASTPSHYHFACFSFADTVVPYY